MIITMAFGAIRLLTLAKPFGGIWPITIGEVFYHLMNTTFCL
jgi:hypothetical protein